MKSSRKGASPELVFLVSILIIGLIIVMVYVYLAAQTIDKAQYQVGSSGGIIEVDRFVSAWASENQAVLAGNPSNIGPSLVSALDNGWCGVVFCSENERGVQCRVDFLKASCPVRGGVFAATPYERTILVAKEGVAFPVLLKGGYES